jgi:cytochrome c oxidase subunit II
MKTSNLLQCLSLFVLTAANSGSARPAAPQDTTPRRIEIVAKRFSFQPAEVTVKKGTPVVLVLTSQDVTHGLKFKEFNLETEIKKDATKELNVTPMESGDFVGRCSHFCGEGHGSMTLTLHVTE